MIAAVKKKARQCEPAGLGNSDTGRAACRYALQEAANMRRARVAASD